MELNLFFRIIVIVIVLVSASISIYFRRKAQKESQDEINRRLEGGLTMIALRAGGLLIWLTTLTYMIYPPGIAWASIPMPAWVRWLGVAGSIMSSLLLIWMFRSLGRNITDSVTIRKGHRLVTEGPYRWIRHPLYTFGGMLFLSLSLIMGTWLIPLIGIPTYTILVHRTGIEEAQLQDRFGENYRQYSLRTGRFLPRFG